MQSKSLRLVSVLITTHNRKVFLERAICSVINQTYPNIEIIVSDDCSDYDVLGFIRELERKYDISIKTSINEKNMGACYTRNKGLDICDGYYVTGLDDDDEFSPDRVETLVKAYRKELSFVTSNTKVITKYREYKLFQSKNDATISFYDSLWENRIGTQVLVETVRMRECGGFDLNLSSAQDADMWIRLINKYGPALRLKEVLYILHTEHDAPRISTSSKKLSGLLDFYKKHGSYMTSSQKKYADFKYALWQNNNKLSVKAIAKLDLHSLLFILKKKVMVRK